MRQTELLIDRKLDHETRLRASYAACRRIAARHGRTYFLATRLLPPERRPAVHALYALARVVDDIVDDPGIPSSPASVAARLDGFAGHFFAAPDTPATGCEPADATAALVLPAVHDTICRYGIRRELFEAFFGSMRMDLARDSYPDFTALSGYTYGSAEVIGLQLLPILGVTAGAEPEAEVAARAMGLAFQLTNFIRDVGEDLDRGRLYLPLDEVRAHGLTRRELDQRVNDDRFRALLRFQIARIRALYLEADTGIPLLDPVSRDCVAAARRLYASILDAVEAVDYRVLDRRATVGSTRRLAVFVPALVRARRARRSHQTHQATVCTTSENPNRRSSTGA